MWKEIRMAQHGAVDQRKEKKRISDLFHSFIPSPTEKKKRKRTRKASVSGLTVAIVFHVCSTPTIKAFHEYNRFQILSFPNNIFATQKMQQLKLDIFFSNKIPYAASLMLFVSLPFSCEWLTIWIDAKFISRSSLRFYLDQIAQNSQHIHFMRI